MGAKSPPWHSKQSYQLSAVAEAGEYLTWTHVIDTPCTELLAYFVSGCEAKVGDGNAKAIVEAENVLRLQVAVINTEAMTVLNCV